MPINYSFGFSESLLSAVSQIPMDALHHDPDAMIRAADAVKPIAERLGVVPPKPHLAGFCYTPVAALGAKVVFPKGSEPKVYPLIRTPEEIDRIKEPDDYLAADLIQQRLAALARLKELCPTAGNHIGHSVEGPITTAMLLMGQDFLLLLYDDPKRAHKLLDFSVRSALGYAEAIAEKLGGGRKPGRVGIPDDFSGMLPPDMFSEFVVPYTNRLYEGLQATGRHYHSELLHAEHLPYLSDMKIDQFDPSTDQYLTPEQVAAHCPCRFMLRIHSWQVRDMSEEQLVDHYRRLASLEPDLIAFAMWRLEDEPKVRTLLEVARELKGE